MNGCAPVSCTSVRRVPAVSLPMQEQNKTVRSVYLFLGIVQIDTTLSGIDLFMVFEYNELNKPRGVLEKEKWVLCPICNNKTRIKVRPDTVLENFPLFCPICPKCKKETIMIISVTRHCFDNARMESFFATFKKEKIYQIAAIQAHESTGQDHYFPVRFHLLQPRQNLYSKPRRLASCEIPCVGRCARHLSGAP